MADITKVNPQIIDVINQVQQATMSPQVVLTSGAGKAYQSVAQAAAIAVQDAADALRNATTIANTASGVAMAQFLATGDPRYVQALTLAQQMTTSATQDFSNIGVAAATVLKGFPAG
jgi:predicted translin family RNA/ssDNA-binding protein